MQNSVYINASCVYPQPQEQQIKKFFISTNLSSKLIDFIIAPEQFTYVHCQRSYQRWHRHNFHFFIFLRLSLIEYSHKIIKFLALFSTLLEFGIVLYIFKGLFTFDYLSQIEGTFGAVQFCKMCHIKYSPLHYFNI